MEIKINIDQKSTFTYIFLFIYLFLILTSELLILICKISFDVSVTNKHQQYLFKKNLFKKIAFSLCIVYMQIYIYLSDVDVWAAEKSILFFQSPESNYIFPMREEKIPKDSLIVQCFANQIFISHNLYFTYVNISINVLIFNCNIVKKKLQLRRDIIFQSYGKLIVFLKCKH